MSKKTDKTNKKSIFPSQNSENAKTNSDGSSKIIDSVIKKAGYKGASKKIGKQTYVLTSDVCISATYTIVGPQEGEGSFGGYYDTVLENDRWDCKSHEKTEIKMRKYVIDEILKNTGLLEADIDCLMGGDLLDQIVPTSFSAREFEIPYFGLYQACCTFGESLAIGSILIDGGFMQKILCSTSSHYGTAERQYRLPLELGCAPSPASQWTVTGAGAVLLTNGGVGLPKIKSITIGKIVDLGINDAANMGAAMAPAAADTIACHLRDLNRQPEYYDLIITGDLGRYGMQLLHHLAKDEGYELSHVMNDCGAMIYKDKQKSTQGGSGAGCSCVVFSSYFYKEMLKGEFKKILLVPTGALLSKISTLQGESIPAVAHAIDIEI